MNVRRSGSTLLVHDGKAAVLIRDGGRTSPVLPLGSVQRMSAVSEPWKPVPESEWDDAVRRAVTMVEQAPDPTEAMR